MMLIKIVLCAVVDIYLVDYGDGRWWVVSFHQQPWANNPSLRGLHVYTFDLSRQNFLVLIIRRNT